MSRFIQVSGACALALLGAPPVSAASDTELAEIQAQIQQLKQSYEARIEALDRRLQEAEARTAKAPASRASCNPNILFVQYILTLGAHAAHSY